MHSFNNNNKKKKLRELVERSKLDTHTHLSAGRSCVWEECFGGRGGIFFSGWILSKSNWLSPVAPVLPTPALNTQVSKESLAISVAHSFSLTVA